MNMVNLLGFSPGAFRLKQAALHELHLLRHGAPLEEHWVRAEIRGCIAMFTLLDISRI